MVPLGLRLGASSSRGVARLVPACKHGRWIRIRQFHQRKGLPYPVEQGLGEFLSADTLKVIAEDYHDGLLERLNDQVRGTVLENKSVVQTVIEAARDPSKVLEFDYACEALNNSFFLESMRPPRTPETSNEAAITDKPNGLFSAISNQFGSLQQFKSNFSAAALGMFSSGWLYCVVDNVGELAIYPIFGAGTLLVSSGTPAFKGQRIVGEIVARNFRQGNSQSPPADGASASAGSTEPSAASSPVSGAPQPPLSAPSPPHARAFSISASARSNFTRGSPIDTASMFGQHGELLPPGAAHEPRIARVGEVLNPLFCVSVHEHAWLPNYGVWGKEEYMKRFWSVLDWEKVVERWERFTPVTRS